MLRCLIFNSALLQNYVRALQGIALFAVSFFHLHDNVIQRVCLAISCYFVVLARNCLAHTLDYIVMQMSKTNREKGCYARLFKLQIKNVINYVRLF